MTYDFRGWNTDSDMTLADAIDCGGLAGGAEARAQRLDGYTDVYHLQHYRAHWTHGLNSRIADGLHVVMWDLDGCSQAQAENALLTAMERWALPTVYLYESSPRHYLAFCGQAETNTRFAEIGLSTPFIDRKWLAYGLLRGEWTIRMGPKGDKGEPALKKRILSTRRPNVSPETVTITRYEVAVDVNHWTDVARHA